ncbi:hypothetical protein AVEN_180569-1 [Araneus ventricosus]|uniref:Uncharacterized protein n=1 Tax=Araneus ventricosus TaxID=182803 RepID=A0A4Y2QGT1_ARAVE|nr:hypothetical protein AVEN_180569-1 [Araneus ventricosus]
MTRGENGHLAAWKDCKEIPVHPGPATRQPRKIARKDAKEKEEKKEEREEKKKIPQQEENTPRPTSLTNISTRLLRGPARCVVMFPPREHRSHGKESPVPFMSAADRRTAAPGGR